MSDKKYTFTITANIVGDDGVEIFATTQAYKNMSYEDVVLVEGVLIEAQKSLNKYATEVKIPEKKKLK